MIQLLRDFFTAVRFGWTVTTTKLCYACGAQFRGEGFRLLGRLYCSQSCAPTVLRAIRGGRTVEDRVRNAGG